MKILITTPSFALHGGIRVILEWANRLTQWHDVTLYSLKAGEPKWFRLNDKVKRMDKYDAAGFDCLVITSPHTIHLADRSDRPKKIFLFMQMLEHLFRPNDKAWAEACSRFYLSPYPMFYISRWNGDELKKRGRKGAMYYIGNGVNTDDFPIESKPKNDSNESLRDKTVLVEGWECNNATKDVNHIAPKVAARLKADGYHIIAFSQLPLKTMPEACDEYFMSPSLEKMNELYSRATILLKASVYDARSCSPMEAMTKGTTTIRAITQGDDDLTNENSIRVKYDENELYKSAKLFLSAQPTDGKHLQEYVKTYSWDYWMEKINTHLTTEVQKQKANTVIVSVIYEEPEWQTTKKQILACNVPVVFVDRQGTGSLAKALNRGFKDAGELYEFNYVWFITNIDFGPAYLTELERKMETTHYAAITPAFNSDHIHCRRNYASGLQPVPFIEFTAPIVRRDVFDEHPLDEDMPYWGHDLDWGYQVRKAGHKIAVDYDNWVSHVYIRNARPHKITEERKRLRMITNKSTTNALQKKHGTDWRTKVFPQTQEQINACMKPHPVSLREPPLSEGEGASTA